MTQPQPKLTEPTAETVTTPITTMQLHPKPEKLTLLTAAETVPTTTSLLSELSLTSAQVIQIILFLVAIGLFSIPWPSPDARDWRWALAFPILCTYTAYHLFRMPASLRLWRVFAFAVLCTTIALGTSNTVFYRAVFGNIIDVIIERSPKEPTIPGSGLEPWFDEFCYEIYATIVIYRYCVEQWWEWFCDWVVFVFLCIGYLLFVMFIAYADIARRDWIRRKEERAQSAKAAAEEAERKRLEDEEAVNKTNPAKPSWYGSPPRQALTVYDPRTQQWYSEDPEFTRRTSVFSNSAATSQLKQRITAPIPLDLKSTALVQYRMNTAALNVPWRQNTTVTTTPSSRPQENPLNDSLSRYLKMKAGPTSRPRLWPCVEEATRPIKIKPIWWEPPIIPATPAYAPSYGSPMTGIETGIDYNALRAEHADLRSSLRPAPRKMFL